jgi:hypothetical protein
MAKAEVEVEKVKNEGDVICGAYYLIGLREGAWRQTNVSGLQDVRVPIFV